MHLQHTLPLVLELSKTVPSLSPATLLGVCRRNGSGRRGHRQLFCGETLFRLAAGGKPRYFFARCSLSHKGKPLVTLMVVTVRQMAGESKAFQLWPQPAKAAEIGWIADRQQDHSEAPVRYIS